MKRQRTRRWVAFIATVCLILTSLSSLLNPLVTNAAPSEMVTYNIENIINNLKLHGRTSIRSNDLAYYGLDIDWSASGVAFKMTAYETTDIVFNFSMYSRSSVDPSVYFTVYVDGNQLTDKRYSMKNSASGVRENRSLTISGITAGNHTIEIFKQTENKAGELSLKSIAMKGIFWPKLDEKDLKIEIIGDSVTAGYGNLGDSSITTDSVGSSPLYQDAMQTFGAIVAKNFNAELSIVGMSGIAVSCGSPTEAYFYNMRDYYPYANYARYKPQFYSGSWLNWNFGSGSDVVVVNLGANDWNRHAVNGVWNDGSACGVTYNQVGAHILEFLRTVRAKNPNANIVWTYGMTGFACRDKVQAAVNKLKNEGDTKVSYLDLWPNGGAINGANGHPSVANHEAAANILRTHLQSLNITPAGPTTVPISPTGAPTSAPTPTLAPLPAGVYYQESFEDGTTDLTPNGGAISITNQGYNSTKSLVNTGRTANWNGPRLNLTSYLQSGNTYNFSAWVKYGGVETTGIYIQSQIVGGNQIAIANTPVLGQWYKMEGSFTVPAGSSSFSIYFQTNSAGSTSDIYIDDILITSTTTATPTPISATPTPVPATPTPVPSNAVYTEDFEDGSSLLIANGGSIAITGSGYNSSKSLLNTGRTAHWNGPKLNLMNFIQPGNTYNFSAWVKYGGASLSGMYIQSQVGGGSQIGLVQTPQVGQWYKLNGTFSVPAGATSFWIYFQTAAVGLNADLYIDDIVITNSTTATATPTPTPVPATPTPTPVLATPTPTPVPSNTVYTEDFEDGTSILTANGGSIAIIGSGYNSSKSLINTGRTAHWNGPRLNLMSYVQSGKTYNFSAWVKYSGTALSGMYIQSQVGGGSQIGLVQTPQVGQWYKLSGTFTVPAGATTFWIYFQTAAVGLNADISIDDIVITNAS